MAEYISKQETIGIICDWLEDTRVPYYSEKSRNVHEVINLINSLPSADVIERNAFTIYGYSLKELLAFALACREQDVTDGDLKCFCHNLDFAYEAINKRQEKIFNACVSKFCTDKIKIEPEALKGEDDG